jgi:flagellar biosynthetic protein FliQ
MHSDLALALLSELFWTALVVSLPIMGVVLLIGVLVSIAQVVTQVQEMSLTFVPKLFAAVVTLIVLGPWMLGKVTQYTARLWVGIPSMF